MEKTRKLDPPDVVYQWTLEIRVRQGATPFLKAVFDRSPIVIGRDSKCDITIPSAHVSRRHLEIHFGSKGIVAIDLGSTNGFKIGKDQLRKAKITPSDVISLGDFEFRAKANPPQKDPSKKEFSDLADGWSDYIDKGITGDTNVGPISYDEAQATLAEASVAEQKAEATEAAEAAIAGHAPGKDSEGYWLAETKRPKLPTLIEDLQKEANALLYGTKQGDLAIEVIHVVGKTVVEMELLAPGEHSWWGGVPTFFGRLLYRPNKDYFPIATHIRPGVFRIQTPSDPRWRVSHRGRNAVEIHRSGPLKGLDGEYGEEVEITHGPFRTLIRCVRAPTRTASRFKLGIPKISRQSMLATLLAVVFHVGIIAAPLHALPRLAWQQGSGDSSFVEYQVIDSHPPSLKDLEKMQLQVENPRDSFASSKKNSQKEKAEITNDPTPTPEDAEIYNRKRIARAQKAPAQAQATQRRNAPKRVSVADFKVFGLLPHLPTERIARHGGVYVRSGASILRGDPNLDVGIITKEGSHSSSLPPQRLPRALVNRIVNSHAKDIARCYNLSLRALPSLKGRLELRWIVGATGNVGSFAVLFDNIHHPPLVRCLKKSIIKWEFPNKSNEPALVTYPFRFSNARF